MIPNSNTNTTAAITLFLSALLFAFAMSFIFNQANQLDPTPPPKYPVDKEEKKEYGDPSDDKPFQCGAYFCN